MELQELPSVDSITSFLSQVSLFKSVDDKYKEAIAQRLENRTYAKGDVIFSEGDPGDALYIVRTGSVGVFIVEAMVGLQFELARLRTGQVFRSTTTCGNHSCWRIYNSRLTATTRCTTQ